MVKAMSDPRVFEELPPRSQKFLRDLGETPESWRRDQERSLAAKRKRERRIERNIRNEASQGRYPEPEEAKCGCGKWGEINYDDGSFRGYYCGGSERCYP